MVDDCGHVIASSFGQGQSPMANTNVDYSDDGEGTLTASGPMLLEVSESVHIQAEVRRVLYALATPEYMEAWLQLPDVDRVECYTERRSFDRFRIDLLSFGERQQSIYGSCFLSKPNRITYLWELDRTGGRARSKVEIHLLGGPDRCILKLRHSGFSSQDEREWHSTMWRRSLVKLCRLIEGIRVAS